MEYSAEQKETNMQATATILPEHVSENLASPLLRAAWLVELCPENTLEAARLIQESAAYSGL